MAQLFTYRLGLLAVPAGVASQRLAVTVNGTDQTPIEISKDATEVEFKAGPVGAEVKLSLDYLDAGGNDSDNLEMPPFTIVDSVPPETPTGFGDLTQVSEEDDGT